MALVPGACAPRRALSVLRADGVVQFRVLFTADANGLGLSLQPHGAEACPQRLSNTVVSAASGQAERCGVRPGDEVLAIGRLTVSSWVFVQTTNALKCLCFPVELVFGRRAPRPPPARAAPVAAGAAPRPQPSAAAVVAVAATAPAAPVPAPAAFDDAAAQARLDTISIKLPCGRFARNWFIGKDGVIRRQLTVTDGIIRCYVCEVRVAEGRGKTFTAKDARGNSFDYFDWAKRHAGYYQYEGSSRNLHVEELGRLVAPEALAAPTLAAPTPTRTHPNVARATKQNSRPYFSAPRPSPPSPAATPGRADATPNAASPASPAAPPAASSPNALRDIGLEVTAALVARRAGEPGAAPASPSGPAATLAARLVAVDAELRALAATAGSLRRSRAEKRKRADEAAASADLAADLADFECRTLAARGPADALRRREHFWAAECAPRAAAARAAADDLAAVEARLVAVLERLAAGAELGEACGALLGARAREDLGPATPAPAPSPSEGEAPAR